jgi:hypothetical protein
MCINLDNLSGWWGEWDQRNHVRCLR